MQVTKEPLDQCQVALTIEVEEDKVVHAVDRAYREYAQYVTVPGFRKGKAPMHFVRQRIPASEVRQRTAELLVEPAYAEAIKETGITPYAKPALELLQLELESKPFIFKAVVPLAPNVELGKYTGLPVERTVYKIPDSLIEKEIERRQQQAAEYPKVDRPVQEHDLVVADVSADVEVRPTMAQPRATMIEIGGDNIPGFDDNVIGMAIGDEKTFNLTYPEDYSEEELQGQPAAFTVKVKEVRERTIPPLDDELVKKLSEGKASTVEEYRAQIMADAVATVNRRSDQEVESRLVDQIIAASQIEYPPIMVDDELEDDLALLQRQLDRAELTIDEYAMRNGSSKEDIIAKMRDEAAARLKAGLILGEIADKEKLEITDVDISGAIAEQAVQENTTPAAMRALIERRGTMNSLRNRVQTKKVLDFLRASAIMKEKVVNAPDDDPGSKETASSTSKSKDAAKSKSAKGKKASDDQ